MQGKQNFMDCKIKKLNKAELQSALPFVWDVFCEFEAKNYSQENKTAFYDAIHNEKFLDALTTSYGAFIEDKLVGIIAMRAPSEKPSVLKKNSTDVVSCEDKTHISLFFVDGKFQKQGIGRNLFNKIINEHLVSEQLVSELENSNSYSCKKITVNSSIFAEEVYKKLGFVRKGELRVENGIQFIPMEYSMNIQ